MVREVREDSQLRDVRQESSGYWREADEPFQFLAYCEEYYALFVSKTRDTTRVFIGRDMSVQHSVPLFLIGDESPMYFTNVIPSGQLRDAYGEWLRLLDSFCLIRSGCASWTQRRNDLDCQEP